MARLHQVLLFVCVCACGAFAQSTSAPAVPDMPAFERRVQKEGDKSLPYRLMVPRNYDKTKSYPLVVWLHGSGEKGDDNVAQLKGLSGTWLADQKNAKFPSFILVPQCPKDSTWFGMGYNKRPETPNCTRLTIAAIADLKKEFNIDDKRLYIGGFSMGGIGTWDFLVRYPNLFAAAFPVAGSTHDRAGLPRIVKDIPVWIFHGDADKFVSVDDARKIVADLKAAGGTPKYTEFPKGSHQFTNAMTVPDFPAWLFAQKRSAPADFAPAKIPDDATVIIKCLPDKEHGTWSGNAYGVKGDARVMIGKVNYRLIPSDDAEEALEGILEKIGSGQLKAEVSVTGTIDLSERPDMIVEKIEVKK